MICYNCPSLFWLIMIMMFFNLIFFFNSLWFVSLFSIPYQFPNSTKSQIFTVLSGYLVQIFSIRKKDRAQRIELRRETSSKTHKHTSHPTGFTSCEDLPQLSSKWKGEKTKKISIRSRFVQEHTVTNKFFIYTHIITKAHRSWIHKHVDDRNSIAYKCNRLEIEHNEWGKTIKKIWI